MNEHPIVAAIRAKLADPSQPFTLIADLEAKPERADELPAALAATQVVQLTRLEPGCLAYELSRDADAPHRFVMYERWSSLYALAAHVASPHFTAAGAALAGILGPPPSFRVLTATGETAP